MLTSSESVSEEHNVEPYIVGGLVVGFAVGLIGALLSGVPAMIPGGTVLGVLFGFAIWNDRGEPL